MIVCYIYFTRIIVYLLKATVPFQYVWLDEMFKETATYIFYVMTAYKFRPMPSHPYFIVDTEDEADDEVEMYVFVLILINLLSPIISQYDSVHFSQPDWEWSRQQFAQYKAEKSQPVTNTPDNSVFTVNRNEKRYSGRRWYRRWRKRKSNSI